MRKSFLFERHWRVNIAEYYLKSYLSKECNGKEPHKAVLFDDQFLSRNSFSLLDRNKRTVVRSQ